MGRSTSSPSRSRSSKAAPRAAAPLSRERVCREALALVDEEGLEALSMRRLGARMGVEAMSLYRHVKDKADLLDAIHAAVLGELRPPEAEGGDWRALLGGLARALRVALLAHPHVVILFATRPVSAPEAMLIVQRVWLALDAAGFAPEETQRAIIAVGVYTVGHTLGEVHGQPAAHLGVPTGPGAEEFEFGLAALLAGLAAITGRVASAKKKRKTDP